MLIFTKSKNCLAILKIIAKYFFITLSIFLLLCISFLLTFTYSFISSNSQNFPNICPKK